MRYGLEDYDIDALREAIENYYYEKFQKTKSVEDEIKYNEICWISDTTVLDVATRMQKELNIDLNNYRKSRKK